MKNHDSAPAEGRIRAGRRWWGAGLAALCGGGLGVAVGLFQPRGPVTPVDAFELIVGGLVVGLVAGALARTRWALLLAPVGFLIGFELVRVRAGLPTTGPLRLDSAFGPLAYLLGRAVAWPLAILSLTVGVAWGGHRRTAGRPVGAIAATTLLAVLAGSLLLPPRSPALAGRDGAAAEEAVAELVRVELGGHEQWIEVRGARDDLPVLLYLSGGPGQSDLAFSRVLLEPLTSDFLVVGWDQRGAGKSYPDLDAATLTPQRAVADTIELARWLCQRYGQRKVYLLGESWGTLLGVLAVREAPELFHAYIASGQMVDPLETDEGIYRDLVTEAMASGNGDLVARLATMGPPPYRSVLDYGTIMSHYPLLEGGYTPPEAYRRRGEASGIGPFGILGAEYGPIEKVNVLRGLLDMFSVMYPQLQEVDLRRDAARLEVPVHVLAGEHELAARTRPAREWFDALRAPVKRWYAFEDSGHSVAFEQADALRRILLEQVRVPE